MSEIRPFEPEKGTTGLRDTECLVFGNGVEIETRVYAKTTSENVRQTSDGREIYVLPQRIGPQVQGTDIVKIHFLPKTSLADRANEPELIPSEEKNQIGLDALEGLLSLARALRNNQITISGHNESEDYYLFADTHPSFAAFLRTRSGFRGTVGGTQVWAKASEFASDENIERLNAQWKLIKQLALRSS